jgi:hypothetical protein
MKKYDFTIRSKWESRLNGRTEFVYLIEWPSEAVMKDRWAKFMADEEWARIKKETAAVHGTLVGEIQDRTLKTLDYSPFLPSAMVQHSGAQRGRAPTRAADPAFVAGPRRESRNRPRDASVRPPQRAHSARRGPRRWLDSLSFLARTEFCVGHCGGLRGTECHPPAPRLALATVALWDASLSLRASRTADSRTDKRAEGRPIPRPAIELPVSVRTHLAALGTPFGASG